MEGGKAAEGVVGGEVAGGALDEDAVLAVGGSTLPSGIGPPITVLVEDAFDNDAVEAVADGGEVIGADAEEVGLDGRVVGAVDLQAVGAVAADDVVEDEGIGPEGAADEGIAVGVDDIDAVEGVAEGGVAGDGGADEVAA